MEPKSIESSACATRQSHQIDEFSQIVRKIVINERRGLLRELAAEAGLSYGAFYNRLNGRAEFNSREINILLRVLADPRPVDCLLAGTGFHAVWRPANAVPRTDEDVVAIAMACAMEALTAVHTTMDVVRRGHLDHEHRIQIERIILQAQQGLSALREALVEACRGNGAADEAAGPHGLATAHRLAATARATENQSPGAG